MVNSIIHIFNRIRYGSTAFNTIRLCIFSFGSFRLCVFILPIKIRKSQNSYENIYGQKRMHMSNNKAHPVLGWQYLLYVSCRGGALLP